MNLKSKNIKSDKVDIKNNHGLLMMQGIQKHCSNTFDVYKIVKFQLQKNTIFFQIYHHCL